MGAFVVYATSSVKVSMAITSPKLGLRVWNEFSDPYNHDQLASNFFKIDQHDHTPGRGVLIPSEGIFDGAISATKLDPDLLARINAASAAASSAVPTGTVVNFAGATAPSGWVVCNGAAVPRAASPYTSLFGVIGTTFGAGDGSTTFNLPNSQDRVILGVSTTRVRGATGGTENETAPLPSHSHGVNDSGHEHGAAAVYWTITNGAGDAGRMPNNSYSQTAFFGSSTNSSPTARNSTGISIQNAGSGGTHNNMQPWIALFNIIKL